MEGLIALLLISWIVSAIGKKKKVKKTANPAAAKPAARSVDPAQNREARIAQMRQELERRKEEMKKEIKDLQVEEMFCITGRKPADIFFAGRDFRRRSRQHEL